VYVAPVEGESLVGLKSGSPRTTARGAAACGIRRAGRSSTPRRTPPQSAVP